MKYLIYTVIGVLILTWAVHKCDGVSPGEMAGYIAVTVASFIIMYGIHRDFIK